MPDPASIVLDRLRTLRRPWTLLVDGRSGVGKSTLADAVRAGSGATLVRLDDVYPGWDGLAAGVAAIERDLLRPRRVGSPARWRRWDWCAGGFAEAHEVPPEVDLVVEGSGCLTRSTKSAADLTVWLRLDRRDADAERRRRALHRDGPTYEPHWDRWAAQEQRHMELDDPERLADIRLDVR